jgi:cytochrome oxidase assembly protein ShyY1
LHARQNYNTEISKNISAPEVDLTSLLQAGSTPLSIPKSDQWRSVQVTGQWLPEKQVLVRKKSMDSDAGFWVITPFESNAGFVVLVNRGWRAAEKSAVDSPEIVPPPTGQVELVGRIRLVVDRTKPKPNDLPIGQVDTVMPLEVAPGDRTISDTYLEMTASRPVSASSDLRAMPAPEITEGPHRSYALQWILFGIMTVIGWVVLVRNEYLEQKLKTSETSF